MTQAFYDKTLMFFFNEIVFIVNQKHFQNNLCTCAFEMKIVFSYKNAGCTDL